MHHLTLLYLLYSLEWEPTLFQMQKEDKYLAVSVQLFPGGIDSAFHAELIDGFVKCSIQASNGGFGQWIEEGV